MDIRSHHRLVTTPSASGGIARLAADRVRHAGLDPDPLLRRARLDPAVLKNEDARIAVEQQVTFLNLAAEALRDDLLGFHLAETFDLRLIGLLYFVMASAPTLGDAVWRAERYSTITNEGIALRSLLRNDFQVCLSYVGLQRYLDRHQVEFWIVALVRVARQLTRADIRPIRVTIAHPANSSSDAIAAFLGCPVAFGSEKDEIVFATRLLKQPVIGSDPYLHTLLTKYCEEALSRRPELAEPLRLRIENHLATVLPHGPATIDTVARQLGISQRTLSRRLAEEGLTFTGVLDQLRRDLAKSYLSHSNFSISEIAWLLGFVEVGAFTNAFKRWTGIPPSRFRSISA